MDPLLDWGARCVARLRSLFRGIFRRSAVEEEIRDEFLHHIELRTIDLVREGLSLSAAHRQAHSEFGHAESHRERARTSRGLSVFDQLRFSWIDVKLGLRMLIARPGLTAVSVFALALGIPIGMAPLHFSNALSAPLPEDRDNRIRAIRYWDPASATASAPRPADFEHWVEGTNTFQSLAAVQTAAYNVAADVGPAASVAGARVTPSIFDVLRVEPVLGRALVESDDVEGATDVVVIGHDVWRARLAADPAIIGRSIAIAGTRHTVVGVMPAGFYFPSRQQLWLPMRGASRDAADAGPPIQIVGRLVDDVEMEEAFGEVAALGLPPVTARSEERGRLQPEVVVYGHAEVGLPRGGLNAMPEFFLAQLVALALLLVACLNVAMLTYARTATRFRELAVRSALGASRSRIVAQIFVETQVLAVLSATVGLFVIDRALGQIVSSMAGFGLTLPYWLSFGVTVDAALWAIAFATVSAAVAGVGPALRVTGRGVQQAIKSGPDGRSGIRFGGVTGGLIALDVAVSVTVLSFAMGLVDYVRFHVATDELVGIAADEYLSVALSLPLSESTADDSSARQLRVAETQQAFVSRLLAEPEVRAVAVADALPRMDHRSAVVEVEGVEPPPGRPGRWMRAVQVDVDFLRQLDQPLHAGRDFVLSDVEHEGPRPAIVNTAFGSEILGGTDPVGRRLRFVNGSRQTVEWREVVGVVGHLGVSIADANDDPAVYLPAAPGEIHPMQLGIHVGPDPERFSTRVREIAAEVDPSAILSTPRGLYRSYPGDWYFMIAVVGGLGLLVLVLVVMAASGVYAIVSHSVSERTREIGVRNALGAPRHKLVWTVLRRSLLQVGAGALVGIPIAAWVLSGTLGSDGNSAVVASSSLAVGLGVAVVGLISVCSFTVPMRRMLGIRAGEALRTEG